MLALTLLAFVAGILTVLAPCVLPLLPIIIGSSVTSNNKSKPYLVTLGLVLSITLFTILLKATTTFIAIDPVVWKILSGGIVILFGLSYLFPSVWSNISDKFNLSGKSDQTLHNVAQKDSPLSSLLVGAALGPVFASCSPTYALIIATILPVNFAEGIFYIIIYAIGLALVMLGIALFGRKLTNKLRGFANPNGNFKKILGIIFLIVGLSIVTGFDKKVETEIIKRSPFDVTKVEQGLLDQFMPAPKEIKTTSSLSPIKPAPEIKGITQWINSNGETIAGLKGKVVLVDFWTYSCINCQRTLPYVTSWYDKYKDKGLVVLGIHAPEFAFEQKIENVQKAVTENKINYPVGLDNSFSTWNNYSNRFWPAHYLINQDGQIVSTHFGEGAYQETEDQIRQLLKLDKMDNTKQEVKTNSNNISPETYLGTSRRTDSPNLKIGNNWTNNPDDIVATANDASLEFTFSAKEVYIVAMSDIGGTIEVKVNDQFQFAGSDVNPTGIVNIKDAKLYKLVKSPEMLNNAKLTIKANSGVQLNVFTFGG
jgi:cytochrome c biogenesis protein CcdA/thiol-disulfide isomerase/thioredoxin